MAECPSCHASIPADVLYCTQCGSTTAPSLGASSATEPAPARLLDAQESDLAAQTSAHEATPAISLCAECGQTVAEGAAFCTGCGALRHRTPADDLGPLEAAAPTFVAPVVPAPAPAPRAMPPMRSDQAPEGSSRPTRARRIRFEGHFFEYFVISLGLLALSAITLGLALPFFFFWSSKYFFTRLTVDGQPVTFTGSASGFYLKALGLIVLSLLTFGLLLPYFSYWMVKYFFDHLDLTNGPRTML